MSDKVPIEPSENYGGGFSFERSSCKMREMVIGIGLAVAVVLSLVFVALYATATPQNGSGGPPVGPTGAQQIRTNPTPDPRICKKVSCLTSTAYVASLMNTSVDPCEDFYTYACGNWGHVHPVGPDDYRTSPTDNIFKAKNKILLSVLGTDVKRNMPWAAERKAKDLYSACMDDYGRMASGGNPLINKVLDKLGGWALAHDLPHDWNIMGAVEKVHVDFWTEVLFGVEVYSGYHRAPIAVLSGGLGLYYHFRYYLDDYYNQRRHEYQKYMRSLATLLARDAQVTGASAKVEQFVTDVMTFETQLANITKNSGAMYWYDSRTISLKELNNRTQNVVNWVSYMKYLFDKAPITERTLVRVSSIQYLTDIAHMVNSLPSDTKNRILNNYFVWQILVKYAGDLSYEYNHARMKYYEHFIYGLRAPLDPSDYCFSLISHSILKDALNHIYIADHFGEENKKKVTEIATYVRQALIDGVDKMDFMDKDTKTYAKKKLSYTIEKLGYPDWMMDSDVIDLKYYPLKVTPNDHFQNRLNLNVYDKIDWNNRLLRINGENHDNWLLDIFYTHMYYFHWKNELVAPVGILQFPLYDKQMPHYLNFGAIGSMFGLNYLGAIDKRGSNFNYHGEWLRDRSTYRPKPWWSNSAVEKFANATKCFAGFYVNKTAGSYTDADGNIVRVQVSKYSANDYGKYGAATEVGGLKHALTAYRAWQTKNKEKIAPALKLSNEQMFFIAYAQTKCYAQRPNTKASPWNHYSFFPIPDELKLNGAVAMLPDFSKAFKCPSNSKLNRETKCSAF